MKGRREEKKKYKARAIRHVGKALENALNLSVNIQHAALCMPSLKEKGGCFTVYLSYGHMDDSFLCVYVHVCVCVCVCVCVRPLTVAVITRTALSVLLSPW